MGVVSVFINQGCVFMPDIVHKYVYANTCSTNVIMVDYKQSILLLECILARQQKVAKRSAVSDFRPIAEKGTKHMNPMTHISWHSLYYTQTVTLHNHHNTAQ